jgi:hypothetical protein
VSNHTPGPWLLSTYSHGPFKGRAAGVYVDEGDDGENDICEIPQWCGAGDEQEANARLIAAAPDLLAALKHMVGVVEDEFGINATFGGLQNARVAVSKAEGDAK